MEVSGNYQRTKQLVQCDNRSISNFIENVTLRFIEEGEYLIDFENEEILSNKELTGSIQAGYEQSIEGMGINLSKIMKHTSVIHDFKFLCLTINQFLKK
jgi:hypothetical protein